MSKNIKVCFILNNVPDFRAVFLNNLCKYVDVIVISGKCDGVSKIESTEEIKFEHIIIKQTKFFGLLLEPDLLKSSYFKNVDVIFMSANLKAVFRGIVARTNTAFKKKAIWWGLFFGPHENWLVKKYRKFFLFPISVAATHSNKVAKLLIKEYGINAQSYNNSQVFLNEFKSLPFSHESNTLKILFVGTYKKRKKIERLLEIAKRNGKKVKIRIIGSGMDELIKKASSFDNITFYSRTIGNDLENHFLWSDVVMSPGNMGLLVSTAAKYNRAVIYDSASYHGPEVELAEESRQYSISVADKEKIDNLINRLIAEPTILKDYAKALQTCAKNNYNVENMIKVHLSLINDPRS